jgi:hypothetical protein
MTKNGASRRKRRWYSLGFGLKPKDYPVISGTMPIWLEKMGLFSISLRSARNRRFGWHRRATKPRRLTLELLEGRQLLSLSVGDLVWNDLNHNGTQEAGEPGISGAVAELFQTTDANIGNADDVSVGLTATDAGGYFQISGLSAEVNYYLVFRPPVGFGFTVQQAGADNTLDSDANTSGYTSIFTLSPGLDRSDLDAGLTGAAPGFGFALSAGSSSNDSGQSVAVDVEGNIFVTGNFQGTVDFDPGAGVYNLTSAGGNDVYVAKYSASGALCWARSMGSVYDDQGCGIAVAPGGDVCITGFFQNSVDFDPGPNACNLTSAGDNDVFVLKLDSMGNFVWADRMGGTSIDYGYGIAVASDNSIYTTGCFYGTADFDPGSGINNLISTGGADIFVSKLDAAGNFVWAYQMGGTGNDNGKGIAVPSEGYVYTTGFFQGTVDFDPGLGTYNLVSAGNNDIFVSKLNSAGNFVWADRIGGTSNEYSTGIAVATDGCVYTTGYFNGTVDFDPGTGTYNLVSAGSNDIFVSKLNSTGNFVWADRIGGTSNEYSTGIAVSSDSCVYITGNFYGSTDFDPGPSVFNLTSIGYRDIFVSKLDSAGHFMWANRVGGISVSNDYSYSIALAADGSIYTTGYFQNTTDFDPGAGTFNLTSAGGGDLFLFKFTRGSNQAPTDISLSPASVWEHSPPGTLVGQLSTSDPDPGDIFTYELVDSAGGRFMLSGSQILVNTGALLDYHQAPSHNVTVRVHDYLGLSFEKTFTVTVAEVISTWSVGNLVWNDLNNNGIQDVGEPGIEGAAAEIFQTSDATIGNADDVSWGQTITDSAGHYSLGGLVEGLTYYITFRPPVGFGFTVQHAGADNTLDSDASSTGSTAIFTLSPGLDRIDLDAGLSGAAPGFGFALCCGGGNAEYGRSMVVDAAGNVYIAGDFSGTVDFDPGPGSYNLVGVNYNDIYIAKYSKSGALCWARGMVGPGYDIGYGVALASDGSVYVTGSFTDTVDFDPGKGIYNLTSAGNKDIFILKLNSAGNFVWADRIGGINSDIGYGIAVATDGSIYTTGTFSNTVDFDPGIGLNNLTCSGTQDIFVLKLDSAGNFVWADRMGGGGYDYGYGIALTSDGSVYTTGYFASTADFDPGSGIYNLTSAGGNDIFVSKLDAAGNFDWADRIGGTGDDRGNGIAVAADGSVYTTGQFQGTADFDPTAGTYNLTSAGGTDIFVSKLDSAGHFAWADQLGGASDDQGYGIALAADGSIYTTGAFQTTADFDPGTATYNLTSAGSNDIFVSKLSASGTFVNAIRLGGTGPDYGYGVFAGSNGTVYSTGYFRTTGDFDPGPGTFILTSTSNDVMFLFSYRTSNNAPTDISLSATTVLEHSATGTLVGQLSATDPDPNESFTYTLLDSSGGRFKIVGSQVQVDNGTLIDYAQATSYNITVRVNDFFGASYDKTFVISVTPNRVGDCVWNDLNTNGIQDAGEPGVAGATVELFRSTDATVGNADDVSLGTTTSDASGKYAFTGILASGNYYLFFSSPIHYVFTTEDAGGDDTLDSDANAGGITAMFTFVLGTCRTDLDAGLIFINHAPTDISLSAATVLEHSLSGALVGQLTTADFDIGDTFTYTLLDSAGGRFKIVGSQVQVNNGTLIDFSQAASHNITVRTQDIYGASYDKTFLISVFQNRVGDRVWNDLNANGIQDASEPGVAGAVVELLRSTDATIGNADDVSVGITTSDASGKYLFNDLLASGNYYLVFRTPVGYDFTAKDAGGNDALDSDVNASGKTAMFTYLSVTCCTDLDAGLVGAAPGFGFALSAGNIHTDIGESLAVDSAGNAYVAGGFQSTVDFDPGPGIYNLTSTTSDQPDIFIAKYSASGALYWARAMGGTGEDVARGIAVGTDGGVYITGYFTGTADFDPGPGTFNLSSSGYADIFVAKLAPAGNLAWADRLGGSGDEVGLGIALASDGSVYTTGCFSGSVDFDPGSGIYNLTSAGSYDIFVSKLTNLGNFLWARGMGGTGDDEGYAIAVGTDGGVYTTGYYESAADFDPGPSTWLQHSAGSNDIFISKLNSAGNYVWARSMGGSSIDAGLSIAIAPDGGVYTTGCFSDTANFYPGGSCFLTSAGSYDIFISKFNSSGDFNWARRLGASGDDESYGIAVGSDGSVYTTGCFESYVDFDPGANVNAITSSGYWDVFISRLDSSGNFISAISLGGLDDDVSLAIALGPDGSVYTTGCYYATADFNPGSGVFNLTPAGDCDIYVSKVRVNHNPTDIGLSPGSVPENSATGTVVGLLSASDPDINESFTYQLLDSAAGRFKIVGTQVQVDNGALLDYEKSTSHNITLRVQDSSGATFDKTLTIAVTDVDDTAPRVAGVYVLGTTWNNAFLDAIDSLGLGCSTITRLGYAIPAGSNQLKDLPWTSINTISVRFDENVTVAKGNLTLLRADSTGYDLSGATFSYNPAAFVATWTLSQTLPADKLLLSLATVADIAGNALDGEWLDGMNGFPSGDGAPGGNFNFRFNVLPGDVNQDSAVTSSDRDAIVSALGTAPGDAAYSPWKDVTGDGLVISTDLIKVRNAQDAWLPADSPAPLLSNSNIHYMSDAFIVVDSKAPATQALSTEPTAAIPIQSGMDLHKQETTVDLCGSSSASTDVPRASKLYPKRLVHSPTQNNKPAFDPGGLTAAVVDAVFAQSVADTEHAAAVPAERQNSFTDNPPLVVNREPEYWRTIGYVLDEWNNRPSDPATSLSFDDGAVPHRTFLTMFGPLPSSNSRNMKSPITLFSKQRDR